VAIVIDRAAKASVCHCGPALSLDVAAHALSARRSLNHLGGLR
jgi:hypothetical protein